MKKTVLMVLVALLTSAKSFAEDYKTAGDGTTWTLTKLAETAGSGVTSADGAFTLSNKVVIAKGDKFELEGGVTVKLAQDVNLEIEGTAKLDVPVSQRVLITRTEDGVVPGVLYYKSDDEATTIKNIDFEYAGLRNFGSMGFVVDSCTFRNHLYSSNNSSNALSLGSSEAAFEVRNCIFERCERSAIGGAANYTNPLVLENCHFLYNGTHNRNYPQVNLTAATNVEIRGCVVIGDREKMRVGGIVVSNLMGAAKDAHLLVENCYVQDCSYGISVYSDQTAVVRNNVLLNNDCIANANAGGSGLNVTDASGQQHTKFTGNVVIGSFWGASIVCTTTTGSVVNFGRVDVPETDENYNPGGNVFFNNGNGGVNYDLYNNGPNTVYAQNCFWLTAGSFNTEDIDKLITDKSDNENYGEVIYKTAGMIPNPTAISALRQQLVGGAQAIYNMNGMRRDTMQKGLNIVVKDGKAKKIVK